MTIFLNCFLSEKKNCFWDFLTFIIFSLKDKELKMPRFNKTEAPSPPKSLRLKKEKSTKRIIELICDYNGCGKVFKKKAGWRKHVNYFHLKVAKSPNFIFIFFQSSKKVWSYCIHIDFSNKTRTSKEIEGTI